MPGTERIIFSHLDYIKRSERLSIYILTNFKQKEKEIMYNIIKSRMAALGMTNTQMYNLINRRYNEHLSGNTFSAAIRAERKTRRAEQICEYVYKMLDELESEAKNK